jgi:hypothetical protein
MNQKKVPNLGRKFCAEKQRSIVVLTAEKWDPKYFLFVETPLVFVGSQQRRLRKAHNTKNITNTSTSTSTTTSNTVGTVVTGEMYEKQRLNRYDYSKKGGLSDEQILADECILHYYPSANTLTVEQYRDNKQKYCYAILQLLKTKYSFLNNYQNNKKDHCINHAYEELTNNVSHSFKAYKELTNNVSHSFKAYKELTNNVSHSFKAYKELINFLKHTCIRNRSFFSEHDDGIGFYPICGHIRSVPIDSPEVNAIFIFYQSTIQLFLLKPLKKGDEIVVGNNDNLSARHVDIRSGNDNSLVPLLKTRSDTDLLITEKQQLSLSLQQLSLLSPSSLNNHIKMLKLKIVGSSSTATRPITCLGYIPKLIQCQFLYFAMKEKEKRNEKNNQCANNEVKQENDKKSNDSNNDEATSRFNFFVKNNIERPDLAPSLLPSHLFNCNNVILTKDETKKIVDEQTLFSELLNIGEQVITLGDLLDIAKHDINLLPIIREEWFEKNVDETKTKTDEPVNRPLCQLWETATQMSSKFFDE